MNIDVQIPIWVPALILLGIWVIYLMHINSYIKDWREKIQFDFLLLLHLSAIKISVINENQFGRINCDRDTIIKL